MDEVSKNQFENHEDRLRRLENNSDSSKGDLIEIKVQLKYMMGSIENLTTAVNALEKKPIKEFNAIKVGVVTSILTLIIGSGITLILTKIL